MKRPLVPVALLYGCGLLLAAFWQPSLLVLFIAALLLALTAIFLRHARYLLIWPLITFAGWINLVCHTAILSPHDLRLQLTNAPEDLQVRGELGETPSRRAFIRDDQESWRTLATLNVTALGRGKNWKAAYGRIVIITPGKVPETFFAGQPVEIAGIITTPPSALAEGLFDYRAYLRHQGIYFQLKADSPDRWQLLSTNQTRPLSDRFLAWAQDTMSRGLTEPDEPLKLLWAMTLGWRAGVTDEVYEPFMQSGTMHIFAISGLHIALIAGILVAVLRVLQMPRLWCGTAIIPLIWFYTGVTGWQPSAVRATVMMSILIGGWSLKRPSNLLNSLAAAALVILLFDPQQLFQASFQLSFFVVLSIALLMPPLEKFRDRLVRTDPLLPRELIPIWKRITNAGLRIVLTWLAISFAAWLGSWPLVAHYFHIFSPVTLLANLLIVPLSSLALACSLGSLICGSWFPFATELFNHSAWFWMKLMIAISHSAIKFPQAFFYVASPRAMDFAIYYGVLIAILSGWAFRRRKTAVMALFILITFYGWRGHVARNTTTITCLPLNGGSAVFVHAGHFKDCLLVDCGNTNSVEFVTKPFLHAQGVNHLPNLALTHGDLRNVGGAAEICESFTVNKVFTSGVRFRSSAYKQLVGTLADGKRAIVRRGDSLCGWTVLHPVTNQFPQADDHALVLRRDFNGTRVLLLSDLGKPGQRALLETTNDLRAEIVVTGLPEQTEPLCESLLEAVQPQFIIVMDSEFPATRRAGLELRARLARRNIPVIYTRTAGAATISLQAGRRISTMNGATFVENSKP